MRLRLLKVFTRNPTDEMGDRKSYGRKEDRGNHSERKSENQAHSRKTDIVAYIAVLYLKKPANIHDNSPKAKQQFQLSGQILPYLPHSNPQRIVYV